MQNKLFFKCYKSFIFMSFIFMLLQTGPLLAEEIEVNVWKSPSCGCCQGWVDYLSESGFNVITHHSENMSQIKHDLGITDQSLHSCHTAKIGNYLIEGHIPISDIRRLLAEKPDILGLSAPGMPAMSPGMGSIEPKDYDILQFDETQKSSIFTSY